MALGTLIRPVALGAINRVRFAKNRSQVMVRDFVLLVLGLGLATATYKGTIWMLLKLKDVFEVAYVPPTLPLALILLALFIMLIISNVISVAGLFYLSSDLDLLLSTPVRRWNLFLDRLIIACISTSALSLIFLIPVLIGYAQFLQVDWSVIWIGAIALLPYFAVPTALAFFISTALSVFVPIKRSRILLGVLIISLLVLVVSVIELARLMATSGTESGSLNQLVSIFSFAKQSWLPSVWVYEILTSTTGFSEANIIPRFVLLYSSALALLSGAYLIFRGLHLRAYSALGNQKASSQYREGWISRNIRERLHGSIRQSASVAVKDLTLLSRDMSQLFQGILLFGIYLIYIYNLRVYIGIHALGIMNHWWRNFIFVSNFCVSAFIVSALCTRFVFPSISLEGRSFSAVLAAAPLTIEKLVKGKFWFWYVVVSLVHLTVSVGAAVVSDTSWITMLTTLVASPILCYGLVGLAIGFGAQFHRFDWESTSQLAVGFGNIAFMIVGAGLILFSMLPIWALVFMIGMVQSLDGILAIFMGALLLWALNIFVAKTSLKHGIAALEASLK